MPLLNLLHPQPAPQGPSRAPVCTHEQELCGAVLEQQETLNAQSSPGGLEKDSTLYLDIQGCLKPAVKGCVCINYVTLGLSLKEITGETRTKRAPFVFYFP